MKHLTLASLAVLSVLASSCAGSGGTGSNDPASGSVESASTAATCPFTGIAYVIEFTPAAVAPSCPIVEGAGGFWHAPATPPNTCTDDSVLPRGTPFTCTYTWESTTPYVSTPDVGALAAQSHVWVGPEYDASCSDATIPPLRVLQNDANVSCVPIPHTGGTGCGLCTKPVVPGDEEVGIVFDPATTSTIGVVGVTSDSKVSVNLLSPLPYGANLLAPVAPLPNGVTYTGLVHGYGTKAQ